MIASVFVRPWTWTPFTVISAAISVSGSVVSVSDSLSTLVLSSSDRAQLWKPTAAQISKIRTPITISTIFAISGPWRLPRRLPEPPLLDPVPRLLAFWTAMMRSALLDWWERLPPALLFLYVSLISSHLLS